MRAFKAYLKAQGLAPTTITNHIRALTNFNHSLNASEVTIIRHVNANYQVGSQQKAILASLSKYRHFKRLPKDQIRRALSTSNQDALNIQQTNNDRIDLSSLPSVHDFRALLAEYWKAKNYREYAILYLLLNYNTRNKDLVAKTTTDLKKVDATSNWLYIRSKSVVYFRNDYKTKARYGPKKHVIYSKYFREALLHIDGLLENGPNLDREVKKVTRGVNESTLMKINVCSNNTIKGLAKISKNRGTGLETIKKSYDCT